MKTSQPTEIQDGEGVEVQLHTSLNILRYLGEAPSYDARGELSKRRRADTTDRAQCGPEMPRERDGQPQRSSSYPKLPPRQPFNMETAQQTPTPGSLSWRLSSHPITLLTFLFFRICTCPALPPSNPDLHHSKAQHLVHEKTSS